MCENEDVKYPDRILPRPNWGRFLHGRNLKHHTPDAILGHRLSDSIEKCIVTDPVTKSEIIEAKYLQTGRVRNLSTSLLGGAFLIDDFAFVQKENGSDDWDCITVIDVKNFRNGVDYYLAPQPYCVVGWELSSLEDLKVPFHRTFKTPEEFNVWQSGLPDGNQKTDDGSVCEYLNEFKKITTPSRFPYNTDDIQATVRMIHRPTNLNYWHITLDIFPFDNPEVEITEDDAKVKIIKKLTLGLIVDQLRNNYQICDGRYEIPVLTGWQDLVTQSSDN